jgi:hypothetical protein
LHCESRSDVSSEILDALPGRYQAASPFCQSSTRTASQPCSELGIECELGQIGGYQQDIAPNELNAIESFQSRAPTSAEPIASDIRLDQPVCPGHAKP